MESINEALLHQNHLVRKRVIHDLRFFKPITGGFLATCLLFIVEHSFDVTQGVELLALCLFSAACPCLAALFIADGQLEEDSKSRIDVESDEFEYLMLLPILGILGTIVGIGLVLWSLHWLACVSYAIVAVLVFVFSIESHE